MKTRGALGRNISEHPLIGVGALMLLVGGSAFFVQRAYLHTPPPPLNAPVTMTLALLAIIPLTWRLRFLMAALVFVTAAVIALNVFNANFAAHLSSVPSIMAIFSSAAYGGRRRNLVCVASIVSFNGGLVYNLMYGSSVLSNGAATVLGASGLIWNLATFLAAWWCGNTLRTSREETSSLWERAQHLVREREGKARRAAPDIILSEEKPSTARMMQ